MRHKIEDIRRGLRKLEESEGKKKNSRESGRERASEEERKKPKVRETRHRKRENLFGVLKFK